MTRRHPAALIALLALGVGPCLPEEPTGHQNFVSPQANPIVIDARGARVYVANTTSHSISVLNARSGAVLAEIPVGLEPVSLALKPDGSELWVSNHVSDSVSVIDLGPGPTFHTVVHTIQEIDANGVTRFDEPVGIAFANDDKAYVALSSTNDVAVIDAHTHSVSGRIHIRSQEPRDLEVRGDRLFVIPFESGNTSELSVCPNATEVSEQCTLLAREVGDFVTRPNLPGEDKNIVKDPLFPDRDLYVFDTASDAEIDVVSGLGTLLYGIAVTSRGEVFITETDARNAENGLEGENLPALGNRMFDNRIVRVDCTGASCVPDGTIALDPPLPAQPAPGRALATPYGIALSGDDSTAVVTAAGTSRVFTLDTKTGAVQGILDLGPPPGGQIPKGVALHSGRNGKPLTAWVLNTLENTVAMVDVRDPENMALLRKIPVGQDPTPEAERLGRIAFNNAFGSSSGTFSCASCHPDGNTDQLLWRIGGACFFGACTGDDETRSTMPIRGLKNTIPLHWDGTLGDPIGGINGATSFGGDEPPNCDIEDDHTCFRQLVDASLAGVMCDQDGGCAIGVSGLPGELDEAARDHMASFLASVAYPPSRERPVDDALSTPARDGMSDFFVDHGGLGSIAGITACGDMNSGCHALPLLTSTNAPVLEGFDAPTMRGLNDRTLQFSLGITGSREALEASLTGGIIPFGFINLIAPPSDVPWDPEEGIEEIVSFATSFAAFDGIYNVGPVDIFQMIQEMSTGFAGAVGRQVTLNPGTASAPARADTAALMASLEAADARGVVVLGGRGRHAAATIRYRYDAASDRYLDALGNAWTRDELLDRAEAGDLVATLTAWLGPGYGTLPQPLLAPAFNGGGPIGNPNLPLLPAANPMTLRGTDVMEGASILVDGQVVGGALTCVNGTFTPICDSGYVGITLDTVPVEGGMHTLQVQNPGGPLSNDMPVCVGAARADCL